MGRGEPQAAGRAPQGASRRGGKRRVSSRWPDTRIGELRFREQGEPLGGNTYWFGSAEYSVPIVEFLRFAVFYDIGMVYEDAYQLNFGRYNDNYGLGIRLNIPRIGPLRLDYGIPIKSDPENESSGRFQFSVGYTREF